MKKTLISILQILSIACLKLTNTNAEIYIFPKIKTSITPFYIDPENLHDTNNSYTLQITCSPKIDKIITFDVHTKILCKNEPLNFTYETLKIYLDKLYIILLPNYQKNEIFIDYKLSYKNLEDVSVKKEFHQKMEILEKIPVILKNFQFEFNYKLKRRNMMVQVLEVDSKYFYSFHAGFEFRITDGKFPKWLDYSLEKNKLVFHGEIPDNINEDYIFDYEIYDGITDMVSDGFSFEIFSYNKGNGKITHTHVFISIFCVIVIILFVVAYVYYFYWKKKKQEREEENDEEIKDSYRNWEKENLKKKEKNFDFEELKKKELQLDTNEHLEIKFKDNFNNDFIFKSNQNDSFSDIQNDKKRDDSDFLDNNPFNK